MLRNPRQSNQYSSEDRRNTAQDLLDLDATIIRFDALDYTALQPLPAGASPNDKRNQLRQWLDLNRLQKKVFEDGGLDCLKSVADTVTARTEIAKSEWI